MMEQKDIQFIEMYLHRNKFDKRTSEHIRGCDDCQRAIINQDDLWSFGLCMDLNNFVQRGFSDILKDSLFREKS